MCTNVRFTLRKRRVAMNLSIKLLMFVVFWAKLYFVDIINTTEPDKSRLVEVVVEIVESCYENRTTAVVGLAGISTEMISKALWSRGSSQIALIDGTSRTVNKHPDRPQNQYKLEVFVVAASSPTILAKTLSNIKASIWWNHMASFLILDWPPSNQGCSNAFEMLWTAWEKNILNAKFMCNHRIKDRLIYTFNPYTSRAPTPWRLDKTYTGRNDHPWTLFTRGYGGSDRICNEWDFEKANDLGGYEISISVTDEFFGNDRVKSDNICFGLFEEIACKIIFPALNATPKTFVHKSIKSAGFVDDKGNVDGILAEVANGFSEVSSTARFVTAMGNLTTAYPYWYGGLYVITQYRGYKSQLSKIRSVIDSSSQIGLYLVCLITVLFFKYFMRQSVMVAYLSTLRIICNSSLPKLPHKVSLKIYLGSLFLFALTMQGIYQGRLASLLTKQERLRNVNTLTDLAELGHVIYGSSTNHLYFDDPEFEGRYISINQYVCTEQVLRASKAACVAPEGALIYEAQKFKLHLSREPLVTIFSTIPIQPDWPLEPMVNTLIMRSLETYRMQYMYNNVTQKAHRHLKLQEDESNDQNPKVLTLEQLSFAFAILGIGLACATVGFIIEVGLKRVHPESCKLARLIN